MGFPTVKNDPWKKGVRSKRRCCLWSDSFWKMLVKQAERDYLGDPDISPTCLQLIREINMSLYGAI